MMRSTLTAISLCLSTLGLAALGLTACSSGSNTAPPIAVVPPPPPPPPPPPSTVGPADCVSGMAAGFACDGLNLAKRVTPADLGGVNGNDIWGWVDPANSDEYALMGMTNGTTFVRVTDPQNPVIVGRLATETTTAPWRDIKVYQNHAFIVADGAGAHGMQIFDLTKLRGVSDNRVFTQDTHYSGVTNSHNVVINEDSGYAYLVGTNTCDEGLHIIDIRTPTSPAFVTCHDAQPETHDAQCVNYIGPDPDYTSAEICIGSNADSIGVTDVSVKSAPATISNIAYPGLGFVHQAWLDDSHRYLIVNDETDETGQGVNTSTIVLDLLDLDNPVYLYTHRGSKASIDHNLYIIGTKVYESNYTAGLQILEFTGLASDSFTETAFFDTHPESDAATFNGAWSVYPYFPSGNIIVSDIERGLFILTPQ